MSELSNPGFSSPAKNLATPVKESRINRQYLKSPQGFIRLTIIVYLNRMNNFK